MRKASGGRKNCGFSTLTTAESAKPSPRRTPPSDSTANGRNRQLFRKIMSTNTNKKSSLPPRKRQECDGHVCPCQFAVSPLGILQRHDRRDGQALPGRVELDAGSIRECAMGTLPWLLLDVAAGRLAGNQIGLQGRHHHRSVDGGRRRTMVHPGNPNRAVLGVFGRRLLHRFRPYVSRNDSEPLYDGLGAEPICRNPHQPRPIVQRHRLDSRADRRQHVFLFQRRIGIEYGKRNPLDSLCRNRRHCLRPCRYFLVCRCSGHQSRGRLPSRR